MSRAVPWKTLDEAIAVLMQRRDVLTRQIAALQAGALDRRVLLVRQYVVLASMPKAADWANVQGWRLPGAKGAERHYTAADVKAVLEHPPPELDAALLALALEVFKANEKGALRAFG